MSKHARMIPTRENQEDIPQSERLVYEALANLGEKYGSSPISVGKKLLSIAAQSA